MTTTGPTPSLNFGDQGIAMDTTHYFTLGTLRSNLTRSSKDWVIEYEYNQDRYVRHSNLSKSRLRSVFDATTEQVSIKAACADRSVVAVPVDSLHIPAGQSITLYMSSPIWAQFVVEETQTMLADLPVEILSDTWFGPNTRHGEICYSNHTNARVFLEKLPQRPERIVTPATIVNEGTDALNLDRVNLPLPMLSIYRTADSFWTQEVVIRRSEDLDNALLKFAQQPPAHAPNAELVSEPRQTETSNTVTRTLSMLFN